MTIRIAMTALALTLFPALAQAMCSGQSHEAQSCVAGTVWDAAAGKCVDQATS